MDAKLDAYKILGVSRDVDVTALRAAYLRMARRVSVRLTQYHPDKATYKDTQDEIRSINAAYETLSDSSLRSAYDASRNAYLASNIARKNPRIADIVDIDAFELQNDHGNDREGIQLTYPCRCGQQFIVTGSALAKQVDSSMMDVQCTGCSEIVRVIYSSQD